MKFPRSSGILLHPTSLPSAFGIGDLGPEAYRFADFLAAAGQKIWQVLPLVPTGFGESPYQGLSSFAGNPLLISLEKLVEHGYLAKPDIEHPPDFPEGTCEFERAIPYKQEMLRRAYRNFHPSSAFEQFTQQNRSWLASFARFLALKTANHGAVWTEWTIREPDPDEVRFQEFLQFEFYRQWLELKTYCRAHKISIMGDIPIYVAHDSADVWSNPDVFELDQHGAPTHVAGVPPDYFSATGQLWGNPIYRWDRLQQDGYRWWIDRFRATLQVVDMVRVDHFRGFEAYWEVPAQEKTAVKGRWVKGPGSKLFAALQHALGELPIVAENLGLITPAVEAIRHEFGFPGMTVLQFAFGGGTQSTAFRPHNYPREVVAYTGTHDNDTTVGWWRSDGAGDSTRTSDEARKERALAQAYLNADDHDIQWAFIRALIASVADTVIIPLQDVLGLGNEARMNLPASSEGNWRWRFRHDALLPWHSDRLKQLTLLYER